MGLRRLVLLLFRRRHAGGGRLFVGSQAEDRVDLRLVGGHQLQERLAVERLGVVGPQRRQIIVQGVQLFVLFGKAHRRIDRHAVGQAERLGAERDRQRHGIETGMQVDVDRRIGLGGLAIAELPEQLALHGQRLRRVVDEADADQVDLVVRQGHVAGHGHEEVGRELHLPGARGTDGKMARRAGMEDLRREGLRLGLLRIAGVRLPGRDHHRLCADRRVVILELVPAGRQLDVLAGAGAAVVRRSVNAGGVNHQFVVDHQKAAIAAGGEETVLAAGVDHQVAAVTAEERPGLLGEGVVGVVDAVHIVGPDRPGRQEGLADRFQGVEVAVAIDASLQEQPIAVGPVGPGRRRIAAVEHFVALLAADGLKGQPAVVARSELQDAARDQLLPGGDGQVLPIGLDLAVMEELDHHDAVVLVGGNRHFTQRVELGIPSTERLGRHPSRP